MRIAGGQPREEGKGIGRGRPDTSARSALPRRQRRGLGVRGVEDQTPTGGRLEAAATILACEVGRCGRGVGVATDQLGVTKRQTKSACGQKERAAESSWQEAERV